MKRPKQEEPEKEQELFRDYLRRVMKEEGLTDRKIEELTADMPMPISKSWVNMLLKAPQNETGIKRLVSLAEALKRSREEVYAAFLEEPLEEGTRLIANINAAYKKLSDDDRQHYDRVLEDLARSMRRAGR